MSVKLNILFLVSLAFGMNAQTKAEYGNISKEDAVKTLLGINKWFSATPSYSFAITHTTFAGHTSSVVHEQKRGFFKKYKEGFHSYMVGINTLQNKNFLLTVDTSQKIILVSDPVKNFESNKLSFEEYVKLLEKSISIKQTETDKGTFLKIDFGKNSPVSTYEFAISKTDQLQSITIYYANEVKALDGKMVKPKLNISFSEYATQIPFNKNELDETRYFTVNKNVLVARENYEKYELMDQRINNNKP